MLQQLALTILQHVKHMILVSPTFGSHMMIEQLLADINTDVEVISFSTYLEIREWLTRLNHIVC